MVIIKDKKKSKKTHKNIAFKCSEEPKDGHDPPQCDFLWEGEEGAQYSTTAPNEGKQPAVAAGREAGWARGARGGLTRTRGKPPGPTAGAVLGAESAGPCPELDVPEPWDSDLQFLTISAEPKILGWGER